MMELLVLLALILLGLSVLIRRRTYTSRRGSGDPPAPVVVLHKISDPAVAHRLVVQDADAFSNRPVMPFFSDQANARGGRLSENVSSAPYGPHWRALRCNITAGTLHPSRLGHLPPLQREAIQDLVAGLSADGAGTGKEPRAVAVRDHLELAVFRVVSRLCFGDGVDECHVRAMCAVIKGFHLTIGALNPLSGSSSTLASKLAQWRQKRRLFALHARMTELCLPLIAAARQRRGPNNDGGCRPYVDSFLHLRVPDDGEDKQDGGRRALSDDEMVNLVVEFLGAGEGTVAACLEWTLAHLVSQPEAQEKLRREVDAEAAADSPNRSQLIRGMPYMNAVILESLRMHPPAPFAQRRVQAGVLPGGAAAPEGGDVFVMFVLGDIGRDSKTWKDPDAFCPERFLAGGEAEGVGPLPGPKETRMMPFGAGHRFCPGVGLSMVIIKCFLAALVREFEWAPPTDAVVDLTELDGFLKTMKKPLTVQLRHGNISYSQIVTERNSVQMSYSNAINLPIGSNKKIEFPKGEGNPPAIEVEVQEVGDGDREGDIQGDYDFVLRRMRCLIVIHTVMQEGTVQDGEALPGGEGASGKAKVILRLSRSRSRKFGDGDGTGGIQEDCDSVRRQEGTVQDGEALPGGEGAVRKGKDDPPSAEVAVEEGR